MPKGLVIKLINLEVLPSSPQYLQPKLSTLHFAEPQSLFLRDGEVVIFRRPNSPLWQCRYKVAGVWQRASTKQRKLELAKDRAKEIFFEAEIRNRSNLPVITRRFKDIAKLAVERMEQELSAGGGIGIIGILVSVALVLAIAALVKHLFFNKK
ncbi:hypothetical protein [Polynucleobacter sp. HIN5]|uniref:hypothetical protein n=1 Tax=Polynucleobacter sp. HIN5 TaxID=3047864 RepID=UPI002573B97B|nr:hypothetical protein [Polynucleobacter sp. HIN5]BEI33015.1 hypothetical protein PHIN5_03830 [Polynucleobacter sp. HIN5]